MGDNFHRAMARGEVWEQYIYEEPTLILMARHRDDQVAELSRNTLADRIMIRRRPAC